ncbi:hypothetical protein ACFQ2B_21020 [Streptomyces stramineus]
MRRIAIVGAGQAGLQLALGLLEGKGGERAVDYEVTVYGAPPEEIRAGRIGSTQVMFEPALALERAAGLHLWEEETPWMSGLRLVVSDPPGVPAAALDAVMEQPAQSVDQRVKTARWLELLEERGGRAVYGSVAPADLERIAAATI